ncbi:MAG: hypothetical protein QGH74_04860, partial [Candidatus Brocadiia bacterium]|nr:hypothetical protein [Candidatus Brocadiia bacterium]
MKRKARVATAVFSALLAVLVSPLAVAHGCRAGSAWFEMALALVVVCGGGFYVYRARTWKKAII